MKGKQSAGSSRREKLVVRSEADIRNYSKSPGAKAIAKRLKAAGSLPTEADLKRIPELSEKQLAGMFRVRKTPTTVRIDADILAWLKAKPGKYQQHLNTALRTEMQRERTAFRKRGVSAG